MGLSAVNQFKKQNSCSLQEAGHAGKCLWPWKIPTIRHSLCLCPGSWAADTGYLLRWPLWPPGGLCGHPELKTQSQTSALLAWWIIKRGPVLAPPAEPTWVKTLSTWAQLLAALRSTACLNLSQSVVVGLGRHGVIAGGGSLAFPWGIWIPCFPRLGCSIWEHTPLLPRSSPPAKAHAMLKKLL